MPKLTKRSKSQQIIGVLSTDQNVINSVSEGDSKHNIRSKSRNSYLHTDSTKVLNISSSISEESGQNSQWWKNLSENDIVKLPIKVNSIAELNKSNENPIEKEVDSDENDENTKEKKISIFASQGQRSQKSRFSRAFHLNSEIIDTEKESNTQDVQQNMDIEVLKNTIEYPVSKISKTKKKRRTKSLFSKKKRKRKYSDAFIPPGEISEKHASHNDDRNNIPDEDTNESLQKKSKELFGLNNKKKRYSEALLNIWDDDQEENEKNDNVLNTTPDQSIRVKSKELFKLRSNKKKYSEAFLNTVDDDERGELEQKTEKSSIYNLSQEPIKTEKKSMFKPTSKNRRYSQAFISQRKDESSDEELQTQKDSSFTSNHSVKNVTSKTEKKSLFKSTSKNRKYSEAFIPLRKDISSDEELQTQKNSSLTRNHSTKNATNKRNSNSDILHNNTVNESVQKKIKSSKKKKHHEDSLNVTGDELDKQQHNNFSFHNVSEEPSKIEKKTLFKTISKNRKYSQAFIPDVRNDSSDEEIVIEEIQTQKDSLISSNRSVNVTNRRKSNNHIIQNNTVNESVQEKTKENKKKKYSKTGLNVSSDDEKSELRKQKYNNSSFHNISEEPSKIEKKTLFKTISKNRKYSQAFIPDIRNDSSDEEIVIEEIQTQKDSSFTSNYTVNVTNSKKINTDIENNTVDEFGQRKPRRSSKMKKYSKDSLNVTSNDEKGELGKHNLSQEPSELVKRTLVETTIKNRKYSKASTIPEDKDDSSDKEIQTQKDSSFTSNHSVYVKNKRNSNIDVIENNVVDESVQRKTRLSSKQKKYSEGSLHIFNEEQEESTKKGKESTEINKVGKVNDIKNRKRSEAFVLMNNSDDSSDEEIFIEKVQTQQDSATFNNQNVQTKTKTESFSSPSKINSPFLRSATKVNSPVSRSVSKIEKKLSQVYNKSRKSTDDDSNEVKIESSSILKENVIGLQKENLTELKNKNIKYSQAFMELIAMSKPDTGVNIEDETHNVLENNTLLLNDSESRFSSIPSINISSELKHPLFRPKGRKSVNLVTSTNENKNKSKVQSDHEQISNKSIRRSSNKVNSSKFVSLLESDFDPILSSTKMLHNNDEKSTGSDESMTGKQQKQNLITSINKLRDNESEPPEIVKGTIKNTPSKFKRKTKSLTTVLENPENMLVKERDEILETQIINNKNSTLKKSTIHENNANQNENFDNTIFRKSKSNSSDSITKFDLENKNKDEAKPRRRTKLVITPKNIEMLPLENESIMETNQDLKENSRRSASTKSIENAGQTNSEEKDTLKKKLSLVSKSQIGSANNVLENNTDNIKGSDIVEPENHEKVSVPNLSNIVNYDKINITKDVTQNIEEKSRVKLKGKSVTPGRTNSTTVDSNTLKSRSSQIQKNINEQSSKISGIVKINSSTTQVKSKLIEQWLNNSAITDEIGPEDIDINKNGEISHKEFSPIIGNSRFDTIFQKSKRKLAFENNNMLHRKDVLKKVVSSVSNTNPPTQALNTKITDFFSKLGKNEKMPPIPKSVKSVRKPTTVCTARLIDGKPYYSKKLFRGKHWCNPHFYKFLQKKLSTQYEEDTINESENVMKYIFNSVNIILKSKKYIKEEVEILKRELARRGIIVTTYDFYCFCYNYLPIEYTDLVVPQTQAYQTEPTVPYDEKIVFKQIKY